MFWRIVENAMASALSRAMLDARLDTFLGRVRALGVLSDGEAERLRAEVRSRLEEVERDGREYRQMFDRFLRGVTDRLLAARRFPGPGCDPPDSGCDGDDE